MNTRTFKDNVYSEFTTIGKVLSSPKRIELLDLLTQSPKSVETLANETSMTIANTSKHLHTLLDARVVRFQKEKNYVIYELASPKVIELLFAIKSVAEEQITELDRLREAFIIRSDELETIELEEWANIKGEDSHVLIDVRPKAEYLNGHLEDAVSIPIDELNEHMKRLPKDKQVIAYCRGPYCVYATEAVEILQSYGYHAARLEAGVHEWELYKTNHSH